MDEYVLTLSDTGGVPMPFQLHGLSQYILPINPSQGVEQVLEELIKQGKVRIT